MQASKAVRQSVAVFIAAACFTALNARAAESAFPAAPGPAPAGPAQTAPTQPMVPSVNNEKFRNLRTQCETDVACGKAGGDICVDAAALLLSSDLPDEFREVNEDQRVKIALRLLERGVDSSNVARGRAYDFYNRIGFLGISAYADPYRANELMEMMLKSGYPGGQLRKIRASTSIIAFSATEADKREGCTTAKKLLTGGKLDADSAKIAKEVVDTGVCTGFEQPVNK